MPTLQWTAPYQLVLKHIAVLLLMSFCDVNTWPENKPVFEMVYYATLPICLLKGNNTEVSQMIGRLNNIYY